jgi:glucokinase
VNESKSRMSQQQRWAVIGVEFGLAEISAALVNERARIVSERRVRTPQRTTRSTVAAITNMILSVALAEERGGSVIVAIGVSVPGVVDPPTERISIPGLKGWVRVDLRQMIEEGLSESGYDIRSPAHERRARATLGFSAHPLIGAYPYAACVAAAEGWVGAARGRDNVIYLDLSEEIDVGIMMDGQPLRGTDGRAGMAGWLGLSESFKHEYGVRGCLATEATTTSLTRRAIEEWSGGSTSILGRLIKADPSALDTAVIIRAARGGDSLAIKVVNETCRWIGRGIANLISLLNPDALVIGGELGLSLRPFFHEIREEARRWAAPEASRECRIVSATVGEKAHLLGAARLAMKRRMKHEG